MKELDIILKSIKNKELLPIYFFHGEEPYFIDVATKSFENDYLSEDEKAFNQTVVYGKDTSYLEVLSLARQFPMMGDKQVIIVKEAQDLRISEPDADALKAYIENPVASTILVFAHKNKKIDSRRSFVKKLAEKKMLFLSESIKEYAIAGWIDAELKNIQLHAKPQISALLAQYLGSDLSRISNELHKLKMILGEGKILDEDVVETHIGISKEFNVFELIDALGKKDEAAAFRIAHFMSKNIKQNPFMLVIANMYNFFSNLIIYHTMTGQSAQAMAGVMQVNPYAIKNLTTASKFYNLKSCTRIISILRDADLKFKGLGAVNMSDAELLKEMVYKIVHVDQFKTQL